MNSTDFDRASGRLLRAGDFRRLVALCRAMRAENPLYADAWFLESVAAEVGGNLGAALKLVDRALEIDHANPEYLTQKARYHSSANQDAEAGNAADMAVSVGVRSPQSMNTLGVVYTRLGRHENALKLLTQAAGLKPADPEVIFNLAASMQFMGRHDDARKNYERVTQLQPDNARSYWALSELEKVDVSDRYESAMRTLAQRPGLSDRDELYLAHALSRIEESRGEYSSALRRLRAAKTRRRESLEYEFDQDAALFNAVIESFTTLQPTKNADASSVPLQTPLFVVGLPRTGTTLVEQILTAHSKVASLGELQDLPSAVKRLSGDTGSKIISPEVIESTARGEIPLERAYIHSIAPRLKNIPAGTSYFIDKTPLNVFMLGYVMRFMPRAKVILLRRDPMDTVLSNYRQLFSTDYSYYNYSYDLEDTACYVAAFEALVDHWKTVLGKRMLVIDYELLVGDSESYSRAMFDYLDLDWEPSCLRFFENKRAVATPSAPQVRTPVYSSAVGRWRKYGSIIEPAKNKLAELGITRTAS
ncbi:hypothetical protein BST95_01410 [Halioglobus japonicus]|uniref:Tetratricopeptide repeat protein n=1 Tax=Halioglobus japonicus TaxID=930805 RepID=A0AAP8SMF3_9GAMM|nr:sulfotransferase [Halioglobus japonicus]AQA17069.1 hypothetical protein BST95_01410 [Halioglobus japonicus]PLW84978.1 tetratricopeptide repeat protein [Halioglobus japonicus]